MVKVNEPAQAGNWARDFARERGWSDRKMAASLLDCTEHVLKRAREGDEEALHVLLHETVPVLLKIIRTTAKL